MNQWKRLLGLLLLPLLLAACGGGGSSDAGNCTMGCNNATGVADLVVQLSANRISSSGTSTVTATVTAVDSNRRSVSGVTVKVSVNNSAVVTQASTTTDANGAVTATIGIGSDQTNRDITVTATAGDKTASAILSVTTDPTTENPQADDLSLVLSTPSVTNGGTVAVTATVTAVDRNRNVLAGIPVTFVVDANATAEVSSSTTDSKGVVTATVGIGADRSNRVITVTATSGALTRTASFAVTGAKLSAAASPLVVAGSTGNVIEYTLVDFNGVAMVGQPVNVSGGGLPTSQGTTDLNGKYRFTYQAPASAGAIQVVAVAAGVQIQSAVTVSAASSSIAPADEMPLSASITPTPSVVAVNTAGSSTNQSELRALFIGANNRPIPRMRVRFDLAGNLSSTDGTISWVGAYAYSDENGVARATFTPGVRSSPTNGITVRMCYDTVDFSGGTTSACDGVARVATNTLTVASEVLSVVVGYDNKIVKNDATQTYTEKRVVQVVDAAGHPKSDVLITPSIDLNRYFKGTYEWISGKWQRVGSLTADQRYAWTGSAWALSTDAAVQWGCPNEDINRNAVREAPSFVPGGTPPALSARREDLNWNGFLDPGKSYVSVRFEGASRTDSKGHVILVIEYPQNAGGWLEYALTVTGTGVLGTEARTTRFDMTSVEANDLAVEIVPPPSRLSPFGISTTCQDPF